MESNENENAKKLMFNVQSETDSTVYCTNRTKRLMGKNKNIII